MIKIPCRDWPILGQCSILIAQNVDLVKTSIYTCFFSFFFAQHFRSSLPLRSYVRDLLCAIARTGAVSLSTGHRPTESQSPGSWAMSRSDPLPSGRSIWLCHGCHVLSRQGPVAVRYLSGALAAFTPPDRLASFRTGSTSTAPTRCRDSTLTNHMRSRRRRPAAASI